MQPEEVSPLRGNARAVKVKVGLLIATMLAIPVVVDILSALGDFERYGLPLVPFYLFCLGFPAYFCGVLLYSFLWSPASPTRQMLDRLIVVFMILACGGALQTMLHPNATSESSGFLTYTFLFIVLSVCGRRWPIDSSHPESGHGLGARLWRWAEQVVALFLVLAPLPVAIGLTRINWFEAHRGSVEEAVPLLAIYSLVFAAVVGMRLTERTLAAPTASIAEQASSLLLGEGATPLPDGVEPVGATGERGILVSKGSTLRREGASGDLWLFRDGILRIPLGWVRTLASIGGQYYDAQRPAVRSFDSGEYARAISDPRNLWIPRETIEAATLRHLFGYDEVKMTLTDGRSRRVLWVRTPGTYQLVRAALGEWLGDRLEVR